MGAKPSLEENFGLAFATASFGYFMHDLLTVKSFLNQTTFVLEEVFLHLKNRFLSPRKKGTMS